MAQTFALLDYMASCHTHGGTIPGRLLAVDLPRFPLRQAMLLSAAQLPTTSSMAPSPKALREQTEPEDFACEASRPATCQASWLGWPWRYSWQLPVQDSDLYNTTSTRCTTASCGLDDPRGPIQMKHTESGSANGPIPSVSVPLLLSPALVVFVTAEHGSTRA